MKTFVTISQFSLGVTLGAVIACSPTKFKQPDSANICDSSVSQCVSTNGYTDLTQSFKVGAGKVDILFVNDNSASMSKTQVKIEQAFSNFIQNLDNKQIDYRIAITTTDVAAVTQTKILPIGGANSNYLTNADSDRVRLFNQGLRRNETILCEDHILYYYNSYKSNFLTAPGYEAGYTAKCPSPDTRGIYTAGLVVSEQSNSFIRSDANLNIILISNDDVRQGRYNTDSAFALDTLDTASGFINLMQTNYPSKYWDFSSIVVKDSTCKANQTLRNAQGEVVVGMNGPAIAGGIGTQYMMLSDSAAVDIDNNARTRGKKIDICQSNYSADFATMATQITEASRMFSMKCTPNQAPTVTPANIPYTWNGDKIIFQRGSEGSQVSVSYRCYTGVL